jgi:hypothetical protein
MAEWIALILAIAAIVLFFIHAGRTRPWHLGWVGVALLTIALTIWHTVGALEPIFNKP